MLHPSTKKLIDRLAEMTELGKLDWAEGENGALVYSTEGYSVCLPDGSGEVILLSIDGKELERAAADELASTMSDAGTPYTQIVADMGAEAGRFARGTETAISSLLAGMEEPEAPAPEEAADLVDDSPEDPGDESAALDSEGIANHQIQAAPDTEADAVPEVETTDSELAEETLEAAAPATVDDEPGQSEEEPVDVAAEMAAESPQAETASETTPETEETVEAISDEVDTETDVTEAVARLADEVNNRDDAAPVELESVSDDDDAAAWADGMPSAVGVAAAAAVGAVASAAGLDHDDEEEPTSEPDTLDAEAEPEAAIAAVDIAGSSAASYVPFGLEAQEEAATPIAEEIPAEGIAPAEVSVVEEAGDIASASDTASEVVAEADDAVVDEPAPEAEIVPETDFVASTAFAATTAIVSPVEPEPDLSAETSEPEPEIEAAPETTPEPQFAARFDAPADTGAAEDSSEPDVPAPAEATSETSSETAPEPETEPVLAASEEPQTYSLSGIGAGFGLGALAAKTEASGIPGPSSLASAEPEKIVIDATDDVLPELEGNLNVEHMEAAVSEINFGNAASSDAEAESEAAEDADGDILKPRTRFNPWD